MKESKDFKLVYNSDSMLAEIKRIQQARRAEQLSLTVRYSVPNALRDLSVPFHQTQEEFG